MKFFTPTQAAVLVNVTGTHDALLSNALLEVGIHEAQNQKFKKLLESLLAETNIYARLIRCHRLLANHHQLIHADLVKLANGQHIKLPTHETTVEHFAYNYWHAYASDHIDDWSRAAHMAQQIFETPKPKIKP